MSTDTAVIPVDYTELHTQYRTYTEKLVSKWGIPAEHVEDTASAILEKFIERDMLKEFDPSRNVLFGTFLGGFIGAYIRYLNEQINRNAVREGVSCDVVIGGGRNPENEVETVYDLVAPKHYDRHEQLEYVDFIKSVRVHLAYCAPTNKNDKLDMVAVWDQIVLHEYEHGRIVVADIAAHFGVSLATGKLWVKRVRDQVAIVVARSR